MSFQKDKHDMGRSIGRRYIEPLKGETIDEPDNHIKRTAHSRNSSHGDRSSKKSAWSEDEDSGNSNSTVHLTQATMASNSNGLKHNHGKSYNWKEMPADAVLKIERPHFRLPHKSSLLKKLSDSSYVMPDDQQQQQQQPHPQPQPQPLQHQHHHLHSHPSNTQYTGDELRGQLPWSYFGARSDVVKPKKSFIELRDDEDLPPVPVPDYTMKFSPKERSLSTGERRPVPAKKFINPKKGSAGRDLDRSRK